MKGQPYSRVALLALISILGDMSARADIMFDTAVVGDVVVAPGSSVDVKLNISGLGDLSAPSLSTFDVDVLFDPLTLAFDSAIFGDPILGDQLDVFDFGLNPTLANVLSPGVLSIFELSLDTIADLDVFQEASFTLATITFNGIAPGASSITPSVNALGDANGDRLTANVSGAFINVVVEPPTLALFSFGIILLGLKLNKLH